MARDRRDIARKDGAAKAPAAPVAPPAQKGLAGNRKAAQHQDQLLALMRALARDAAHADHAVQCGDETP